MSLILNTVTNPKTKKESMFFLQKISVYNNNEVVDAAMNKKVPVGSVAEIVWTPIKADAQLIDRDRCPELIAVLPESSTREYSIYDEK